MLSSDSLLFALNSGCLNSHAYTLSDFVLLELSNEALRFVHKEIVHFLRCFVGPYGSRTYSTAAQNWQNCCV